MSESHTTSSAASHQFSVRTLAVLMCVVSGFAALLTQAGADMTLFVSLCCIWSIFVAAFGGVRYFLYTGLLLGLLCSGINYCFFTSAPDSIEKVFVPFGLPVLVLNVFALVGDPRWGNRFSVATVDLGSRRITARKSLTFLFAIPLAFLIAAATGLRGLDLILVWALVFFASVPWAIFWRRRRLTGYVFKKNWIDKLSWGIIGFAFLAAVISAIPILMIFAGPFVNEIEVSKPSRESREFWIRFFIFSFLAFQLTIVVAPILVGISWLIQWFRDRWWHRLNWLAIGWSIFVFVAYLVWLKYV